MLDATQLLRVTSLFPPQESSILSLDRCFLQYKLRKVYFGLYLTYKFEQPKSVTGQTFYSETHRADTGPDNHTAVCGIPPKAVFTSTHDILP